MVTSTQQLSPAMIPLQINKIRNSIEDRKKLSQEEKLQKWKEHFKNLHENSSEITDKPTKNIIDR